MENQVALSENNFVKPHFITELGEEGLTLHEVAKSLGVDFPKIKTKFDRMHKSLRIHGIPYGIPNETNGLEFTSYYLTVDNAKFFVAKWDSVIGDSYLRYLLQCEKKLTGIQKWVPS